MQFIDTPFIDVGERNFIGKPAGRSIYSLDGAVMGAVVSGFIVVNGTPVPKGNFFSRRATASAPIIIETYGEAAVFGQSGFTRPREILSGVIPETGDVKYIDGCTDSLLIAPPRLGDPCLNALYFPPGVDQTFHTHPSQRLGVVLSGRGLACFNDEEAELTPGEVFFLPTDERHRFRTLDEPMVVIAFHPDSDWGPTDEEHPMINRTIL